MENQTILSNKRCKESWCKGFGKKLIVDKKYGLICPNSKRWNKSIVFINKEPITVRTIGEDINGI